MHAERTLSVKKGIVIAHYGKAVLVELESLGGQQMVWLKRRSDCSVGDHVVVLERGLRCLERKNSLKRQTPFGIQTIVSNVDCLGIIVAPIPKSPAYFVDSSIIAAREEGIKPFLILNKKDLPQFEDFACELESEFASEIPFLKTCIRDPKSIQDLRAFLSLRGRTLFLGVSGVGKSSLVNALVPDAKLHIGGLASDALHGSHETTVATLHHVPGGGELVDTPGIRDLRLANIPKRHIAKQFVGLSSYVQFPCRFRDCLHVLEPGCVVRDAVKRGELAKTRYASYLYVLQSC